MGEDEPIQLWTDGGCWYGHNIRPGSWAFLIIDPTKDLIIRDSGWEIQTTSNRMEMTAAIKGLQRVSNEGLLEHGGQIEGRDVLVHSDSQYLVRGAREWMEGWARRGWLTASGGEVANLDLWKFLHLCPWRKRVLWRHVKGHSGIEHNETVDAECSRVLKECLVHHGYAGREFVGQGYVPRERRRRGPQPVAGQG